MPTTDKLRNKLLSKLTELFQLNQPDLDFGFYRIMHAKAQQVQTFIDKDLLKIIEDAFGQVDDGRKAELQASYEKAIQTAKDFGAPNPEETEPVKKAKVALETLKDSVTAEADVYDHLYRFFERYYDDGDFLSRRYYARENSGKAAPFAIPYNGEEVKLHWANADQYYIKTAEYFSNYSFDITQAAEIRKMSDGEKVLNNIPEAPLRVHFRIVDAGEGEHGNVKETEDKKRFFVLHTDKPAYLNEAGELVVNFEYKSLPSGKNNVNSETEKLLKGVYGKNLNKGDMPNLSIADKVIATVDMLDGAKTYLNVLRLNSPTDKIPKRPLLTKYVNQYTARNTCDYFIHKDLGGFLKRELDFYIKNEVMHLDDIENADAPAVESYLAKLKVIRKIATKLIDFLAQLEDFQKKLWLKKKFVTETNYCITLDRIPEELYEQIAANDAQRKEWVKIFAIDEIRSGSGRLLDRGMSEYSVPLTIEFLKANDKLVLDTVFFTDEFKAKLVESIEDFDEQCGGLLIHSENFQSLNMLQERYREQVKCIHIDPPYNTATSGFLYKNSYEHSSWLSLMESRIILSIHLLSANASYLCHIDENEYENLHNLFEKSSLLNSGTIVWDKRNPMNGGGGVANQHEYIIARSNGRETIYLRNKTILSILSKASQLIEKNEGVTEKTRKEFSNWVNSNSELSGGEKAYRYIDDEGRIYQSVSLRAPEPRDNPKFHQPLIHPKTGRPCAMPPNGFSRTPETLKEMMEKGLILFGKDETTQPRQKSFLTADSKRQMSSLIQDAKKGKTWTDALGISFPYCHPVSLYEEIVGAVIPKNKSVTLDYFAGSGTTGHAILNLNREDQGVRKYILVEMGDHFDTTLIPRIQKVIYSSDWKNGKPTNRQTGISHCFKYLRLESYEDTLNNLAFDENHVRNQTMEQNTSLREDYMLRYLLDVETRGSQSLLNIDNVADPTAYTLQVKKPGSDEQVAKNIDLIETFNYLIGLRVTHYAAPQTFTANFIRKPDPELPEDQHTKLVVSGKIQPSQDGKWWFRKLEGRVPADSMNPNNGQKEKVLIVWRKLTGNLEEDNLMLDEWFQKYRISTRDFEFDTIYVNGYNKLPNLQKDDENWKVRLIEEEFHKRMWETGGVA